MCNQNWDMLTAIKPVFQNDCQLPYANKERKEDDIRTVLCFVIASRILDNKPINPYNIKV